jgi:geranylgeranyl pyrophosphate synthase
LVFFQEPDVILRDDLLQLEYGNKIAILGGDYLLANACTGLADLRNTYIVEMISIAIAEFTQVTFSDQLKLHFPLFIIQS